MVWLPEPSLLAFALACVGAFWLLLPRARAGQVAGRRAVPAAALARRRGCRPPGRLDVARDRRRPGPVGARAHRATTHCCYDAGAAGSRGLDFGEAAVVPALRALGVRPLDTLMVSHGDNDHAGGMRRRAARLSRRRACSASKAGRSPAWACAEARKPGAGTASSSSPASAAVVSVPAQRQFLRAAHRSRRTRGCCCRATSAGTSRRACCASRRARLRGGPAAGPAPRQPRRPRAPPFVPRGRTALGGGQCGRRNRFGLPRPEVVRALPARRRRGAEHRRHRRARGSGSAPAGAQLLSARRAGPAALLAGAGRPPAQAMLSAIEAGDR